MKFPRWPIGTYQVYGIEVDGKTFAVRERAALKRLRTATVGSNVFIEYRGKRALDEERTMFDFNVYVRPAKASAQKMSTSNAVPF